MTTFDKNRVHIVYASDDGFSEILGISMVSLYENSKDMESIAVYILDSGITDTNKKKLESICKTYNRALPVWIKAKNICKVLSMDVVIDRGSLSQYARLFVSGDLPADLHRVLYLDCDVLDNASIRELWNLDLHGKTIGALMDAFSRQYRSNINLQPDDIMFNSGVMLIDLDKWKAQQIEEKLMKFIAGKRGKIQQGDQGALNAVLSHDTYCFEPRFNSVTIYYDFSYDEMLVYRKPPKFYDREEIKKAADSPVIIHFTTSFLSRRPWVEGCKHKYVDEWMKYKKMSPWADKGLWKYNKATGLKGLYIMIIEHMPRKIVIHLSGVLQAYGRPLWMKIR